MLKTEMQLEHALDSDVLICDIRTALNTGNKVQIEWTQEIDSLIKRIDKYLKYTPTNYMPEEWEILAIGLRTLARQTTCLMIAKGEDGNLVEEREKCDALVSELCRLLSSDTLELPDGANSTRQSLLETKQCTFNELSAFLLLVPLATLYWQTKESDFPFQDATETLNTPPSPMLRVIVFLDHTPIASPQFLKSNVLYPLAFRVRGLSWPDDAKSLKLDLFTTCPTSEFAVSELILEKPPCIKNDEYEGELAGQIKFNSGQSSLLDDLVFTISGAFEKADGNFMEIPVIGHNELRLRVVNEDRHPLMTGNRRLDQHIEELVTKLLKDCPKVRDELKDLMVMLEELTNLLAAYAQEAIWKERNDVLEPEFQKTVLRDLRRSRILGQEVQEHTNQAGGIPDIKYRGVIVELKVERENGDREHISKKYTGQPTQYAGVEARQVSILLVLDLTSKDKPPGDIRNDIILTDVETHGGEDGSKEFPSKAFVFVINGNMKSPSTYS